MIIARMDWQGRELWASIEDGIAYEAAGPGDAACEAKQLGPADEGRILAPILPHNKLILVLGNFDGKQGRRGPGLSAKPMNTVIGHKQPINWPTGAPAPNFEVELGVVIGRRTKNVSVEEAKDHIFGYTITNDISCFPVMQEDRLESLSTRFKFFDDSTPMGPWIETEVVPREVAMRSYLNGELMQSVDLKEMAFTPEEVVSWISEVATLEPGDVISMASPLGHTAIVSGDVVRCVIDGIGELENQMA